MEITKNTSKHSISSNFNYPKIYSDIKEVPEESKGYSKSKVHDAMLILESENLSHMKC